MKNKRRLNFLLPLGDAGSDFVAIQINLAIEVVTSCFRAVHFLGVLGTPYSKIRARITDILKNKTS